MRRMLALMLLGASTVISGAPAFAADDTHSDHPNSWQTPQVMLQIEPANSGAVAGSEAQRSVYSESRYENYGH